MSWRERIESLFVYACSQYVARHMVLLAASTLVCRAVFMLMRAKKKTTTNTFQCIYVRRVSTQHVNTRRALALIMPLIRLVL